MQIVTLEQSDKKLISKLINIILANYYNSTYTLVLRY